MDSEKARQESRKVTLTDFLYILQSMQNILIYFLEVPSHYASN